MNISDAVKHLSGSAAANRSAYGMVIVDYQWSWPGAIMASVHNLDETAMLSFQNAVQSDMASPDAPKQTEKAQTVEGAWWKPYPNTDLFLFLGNASKVTKQVTVKCAPAAVRPLRRLRCRSHLTAIRRSSLSFCSVRPSPALRAAWSFAPAARTAAWSRWPAWKT